MLVKLTVADSQFISVPVGTAWLAFGSVGDMLIVALFGALGYGVSKIVAGEFELGSYLSGRRDQR